MKLLRTLSVAALVVVAPESAARTYDAQPEACMVETPITAALVAEAGQFRWRGADAHGAVPAVLIGSLWYLRQNQDIADGASGSVVFVRDAGGGWRAFLPSPDENVVGAFLAPTTGAVVLATQVQTEGPGQSWTLLHSTDGLATGTCTQVAFPAAVNQEQLVLADFDMRTNGRGEIVGSARVERERAETTLHFIYRTRDGGATWRAPERLSRFRQARSGLFEPIADAQAPQTLIDELMAYAASR